MLFKDRMDIDNFTTVGVIGFKKSGIALCDLLLSLGKKVRVSEAKPLTLAYEPLVRSYCQRGVEFEWGGNSSHFLEKCQLIVLSPGVDPQKSPAVVQFCQQGLPVVGEVEFSSWFNKARLVAITGTNGKTTTTFLTYRLLKEKNPRTFLAGNIGIPFSSVVTRTRPGDVVVLEVSSFQLETICKFRPFVSCLTNLEPDHLDRYEREKDYYLAKKNIFRNQQSTDYAVLNENISCREEWQHDIKAAVVFFGKEFDNENFSAAYRVASLFGVSRQNAADFFAGFKGLPHRMQFVRRINEVTFINDSKATNPASTVWALKNSPGPLILIAGGRDKGAGYDDLKPWLYKIKRIHLFGEAKQLINDSLASQVPCRIFSGMDPAVRAAYDGAEPGDTVLLSPMCSSYDMFSNYIERGRKYIQLVNNIDA